MDYEISGEITPDNVNHLEAVPGTVDTELPFLRNVTKEERKKLRKMGLKRAGYVSDVYTGIKAHTDLLPTSFSFADFTKDIELKAKLPYIKQIFKKIIEKIDDTDLVLGHDLIKQADFCYSVLKLGAKENAAVKALVTEIGTVNTGMGRKKNATSFSIEASSNISVKKIVTGHAFVNTGTTVLKCKAGNELASKIRSMDAYVVEPGNSVIIPKGWTTIDVTNLSTTAAGSFSVKVS